jgi:hypothetical protein
MNSRYSGPSHRLDSTLEEFVAAKMRPNELIFQSSAVDDGGFITICLIEIDVLRVSEPLSSVMGGLCSGGGRALVFRRDANKWCFVEESEWVS